MLVQVICVLLVTHGRFTCRWINTLIDSQLFREERIRKLSFWCIIILQILIIFNQIAIST